MKATARRIILVTGSTKNIGRAIALEFARPGITVIINSRTRSRAVLGLLRELTALGAEAHHIAADLSATAGIKKLFREVKKRHQRLDVLVNTVGGGRAAPFPALTAKDWTDAMTINFLSAVHCSLEASKLMAGRAGGSIISVASVRGLSHAGHPQMLPYSAAKAALINFSCTLAKALAPKIRVNAVAPGYVTPGGKLPLGPKGLLDKNVSPNDVAAAVRYLVEASTVTGEVLVVDAGFALK